KDVRPNPSFDLLRNHPVRRKVNRLQTPPRAINRKRTEEEGNSFCLGTPMNRRIVSRLAPAILLLLIGPAFAQTATRTPTTTPTITPTITPANPPTVLTPVTCPSNLNSCSANDVVTTVVNAVGAPSDPTCSGSGDTIDVDITVSETSTSNQKYDLGMYI